MKFNTHRTHGCDSRTAGSMFRRKCWNQEIVCVCVAYNKFAFTRSFEQKESNQLVE